MYAQAPPQGSPQGPPPPPPRPEVRVENIHVDGLKRTRSDMVMPRLDNIFDATTVEGLMEELTLSTARLETLDAFKDIRVALDEADDANRHDDDGKPIDVHFAVTEKKMVTGSVGGDVGKGEGGLRAGLGLRNVTGYCDNTTVDLSYTTRKTVTLEGHVSTPMGILENWDLVAMVNHIKKPWAMHDTDEATTGLNYTRRSKYGLHRFQYHLNWRRNVLTNGQAPHAVRRHAGHSLVSAVAHTWERDVRDDAVMPTRGVYVSAHQQLAGLGGSVAHMKNEIKAEVNIPIGDSWSAAITMWGGHIWNVSQNETLVNDRFHLGGPTTLRGFGYNGVERTKGASLGGDAYVAGGLHLYGPVPFSERHVSKDNVRMHMFTTGGALYGRKDVNAELEQMGVGRVSCGVGLMARFGPGRLEVNYAVPLITAVGDDTNKGLSFGVSVQFL